MKDNNSVTIEQDSNSLSSSSVRFNNKSLLFSDIATFIVFLFPPIAGILYVAGSIVYWPSFKNINPYDGGILFTLGSLMLVVTDFAGSYLQPHFTFFRPFQNIGSIKALCQLLGNISYTIGSIYFLPGFSTIVGENIFIISSLFLVIPQILGVWGVCMLNSFNAQYYVRMRVFKRTIIVMNICLTIGCICFFIGTFLFKNQSEQKPELYQEGVALFISGSFCYFLGPVIGLKMRKIRVFDPLSKYHEQIQGHFLPSKIGVWNYLTVKHYLKPQHQGIILSNNRSIIEPQHQ